MFRYFRYKTFGGDDLYFKVQGDNALVRRLSDKEWYNTSLWKSWEAYRNFTFYAQDKYPIEISPLEVLVLFGEVI